MCERVTSDGLSLLMDLESFRKTREHVGSMGESMIAGSMGPQTCPWPSNAGNLFRHKTPFILAQVFPDIIITLVFLRSLLM